ncbi:hypothetical protein GCM10018987_56310 [Streptomyces cremeus]
MPARRWGQEQSGADVGYGTAPQQEQPSRVVDGREVISVVGGYRRWVRWERRWEAGQETLLLGGGRGERGR